LSGSCARLFLVSRAMVEKGNPPSPTTLLSFPPPDGFERSGGGNDCPALAPLQSATERLLSG
jgi:hypothetical protein